MRRARVGSVWCGLKNALPGANRSWRSAPQLLPEHRLASARRQPTDKEDIRGRWLLLNAERRQCPSGRPLAFSASLGNGAPTERTGHVASQATLYATPAPRCLVKAAGRFTPNTIMSALFPAAIFTIVSAAGPNSTMYSGSCQSSGSVGNQGAELLLGESFHLARVNRWA